jgi:protein-S-isoprenylcysteine O-methyltransferase Ste14
MSWKRAAPLLLTIVGALGIGGLWLKRAFDLGLGEAGVIVGTAFVTYMSWMWWESRVSVAELDKHEPDRDRGTMEMAAFAKISLLLGALVPAPHVVPALALAGLSLIALGIATRTRAIAQLGKRYSHRIRLPIESIEKSGMYARVRHPAYLGTLLVHLGVALVFPNPFSIAAWMLLWVPAVVLRTELEDRYLCTLPEYEAYADRVRTKLIPLVW